MKATVTASADFTSKEAPHNRFKLFRPFRDSILPYPEKASYRSKAKLIAIFSSKKKNYNYQFGKFFDYLWLKTTTLRVIAKRTLKEFWEKNPDSEQQLLSWYREISKLDWKNPNEIKERYASASILKNSRAVFNICGNKYRLIVEINFSRKWVFIRFIGTHREYDKIDANNI